MGGEEQFSELVGELRGVVERLDQLAFDALREAVAAGERSRPEIERRIVRARNAVERAISILERSGSRSDASEAGDD